MHIARGRSLPKLTLEATPSPASPAQQAHDTSIFNSLKVHRSQGKRGLPEHLRTDKEAREFVKTLSKSEQKNWSKQELLAITRGVLFSLRAMGIESEALQKEAKQVLASTFNARSLRDQIASPFYSLKREYASEEFQSQPLLSRLGMYAMAPTAAVFSAINVLRHLATRGRSATGGQIGRVRLIAVAEGEDIGYVAAHETVHEYQNKADGHPEYFSFVVHAAYLATFAKHPDEQWEFAPDIKRGGSYWEAMPMAAAATIKYRGILAQEGADSAMKFLQAVRFAKDIQDIVGIAGASRSS